MDIGAWLRELWSSITSSFSYCQLSYYLKKFPQQEVTLNGRRFLFLKQLGEGGYAFVYLVKDKATNNRFALKRILAGSAEQLHAARNEIQILHKLNHPNLLRLLDHAVENNASRRVTEYDDEYGATHVVWMLFPVYEQGSLLEEISSLHAAESPMPTRAVIDVFLQLCRGLQHMHQQGLAHRDIKPHNVLLERTGGSGSAEASARLLDNGSDVEAGDRGRRGSRYHAVIVDFGSSTAAQHQINSRMEAIALQEEAEANCTAPYRAPELFDVPSSCTIDERIDVWSLGCTLYHMMYGASPFQKIMDQGGSLALAVMECAIPWPKLEREKYPEELHILVKSCLTVEPGMRPFVHQVMQQCEDLAALSLADPKAVAKI